ncbi:hypothetical protein HaLaN_27461, partial [Haematococcus lacustris]
MAPHPLNRQFSSEVRTSLTSFRLGNSGLGWRRLGLSGLLSLIAHAQDAQWRKSRTPRGGGRPSSLTADGVSGACVRKAAGARASSGGTLTNTTIAVVAWVQTLNTRTRLH